MCCRLVTFTVLLCIVFPSLADDPVDGALRLITNVRGRYTRDETNPANPIINVSLGNTKITDERLKELAPLTSLETLSISCTGITDVGLKVKDLDARVWYMVQTLANGWSRNVLLLMIRSESHSRQGQALSNFHPMIVEQRLSAISGEVH
jgi:hypothetical protein